MTIKQCIKLIFLLVTLCERGYAQDVINQDVSLIDLSLEELLQIRITSVSRQPEKLSESPSAIQVITSDQIRRSGATTLPEALRLVSNLQVAQQNSFEWAITSRGFNTNVGNKLLVMIDGRTVYTPLFSGVFWDRQGYLLEDIERIEVVSGPGTTLWGANAVNGVINIITRSAHETQGTFLEAGFGTTLNSLSGFRYGSSLSGSGASYRIYGRTIERGNEFLSDGSKGIDAWSMAQIGFRVDSDIDQNSHWTIQGDYYQNYPDELFSESSYATGGNILARWNHIIHADSDISLQFYFDQTQIDLPFAAYSANGTELAPAGVLSDQLDTVDFDFQHRFQLAQRQEFIWGLAYRYTNDQVENAPSIGFYPEQLEQDLFSAFIQDEIEIISNSLFLTLGAKIEKNDYTGTELAPSTRLKWLFSKNNILWTSISKAVRNPSRIDRDLSQPTNVSPVIVLQGGENFDTEKVIAYEVGYRGALRDKYILSASVFYNEYTDIRSTGTTPETIVPFFFENNLKGETSGLELSLKFQASDYWNLSFGYSHLEEDIRVVKNRFDLNNALNETSDPKDQLFFRSSTTLFSTLDIDFGARWIDKLPTDTVNGGLAYVPSYSEIDIRIGWAITEYIEASLVGQNLLNKHHHEFGLPNPAQREIGRNIYSRLQMRF